MLKFPYNENRKISSIKFIVGIDPSTTSTGICMMRITDKGLELVRTDNIRSNSEDKIYEQMAGIKNFIEKHFLFDEIRENVLIAKEQQPLQYGKFTTINTLISIGKIHGLIEDYAYSNGFSLLDVPVATIRKTVLQDSKADKEQVFQFLSQQYPQILEYKGSHDVSDAIAVAYGAIPALKNFYKEKIKEIKKEIKKYKSNKKIKELEDSIINIKNKMED